MLEIIFNPEKLSSRAGPRATCVKDSGTEAAASQGHEEGTRRVVPQENNTVEKSQLETPEETRVLQSPTPRWETFRYHGVH